MTAQTWPMVKLGDVIILNYGKNLPNTKRNLDGSIKVFGSNGVVGYHDASITRGEALIVGRKGSIGKIHYSKEACFPIDTTYYIDKNSTKQNIKWLLYLLKQLNLENLNKATGVPGLNRLDAYNIKIPLPPLSEQKRIAAILDKAYDLCQLRRHALKKLDVLGEAIFHNMFIRNHKSEKYKTTEINKVTKKINKISSKFNFNCSDFIYIDISSISRLEKRIDNPLNIEVGKAPSRAKQIISTGDILVSTVRPNLNAVAKVEQKYNNAIASTGFCVLRPSPEELNETYLYYWVKYPTFVNDMIKQATGQSYPAVSDKIVKKSLIPLPPLAEQERFAARIAKLEALQEQHRQALAKQEMLFQSLQQRAFRGEL